MLSTNPVRHFPLCQLFQETAINLLKKCSRKLRKLQANYGFVKKSDFELA